MRLFSVESQDYPRAVGFSATVRILQNIRVHANRTPLSDLVTLS
jgi:hypothetical protein